MPHIAYVNGQYVPQSEAVIQIEDRGYQFADGIYEVCVVVDGRYWDMDGHLARMTRSLNELSMEAPMEMRALKVVMGEVVRRNRLKNALVYMQVTRGVAPRNHAFPPEGTPPALIITARRFDFGQSDAKAAKGVGVITQPDIRWGRVDIKTIGLLPNALAKEAARQAGAFEALLVRDGFVTECSSSNAWIVDKSGALITHPKGNTILGGITRQTAIACAEELQIKVIERPFTVEEAKAAPEAFLTSATSFVMPIVSIDGEQIASGAPGPVALRLRQAYKARAANG
ncbi:D-amino-acid transaminase [Hyphococcus sp.]|uniref:D-amino-acid transaminase n=1 Tax=Hyphococcus sp. TaxID=2038636 RepID=UPI00208526E5|nr:MAG: D-amino-acid transaminase [Marinicaulis sp.]